MGRFRIQPTTHDREAASGAPTHSEPRWPASLAVLAALALYITLDVRYELPFGPRSFWPIGRWFIPIVEMALLLPLTLGAPRRHRDEPKWARIAAVALIAVVTLSNVVSLGLLVDSLLYGSTTSGTRLFLVAINIWLTNVLVFALRYWELDRGGPGERGSPSTASPTSSSPR